MNIISLDEMEEKIELFRKMYDSVRLVDPVKKKVIAYKGYAFGETQEICYIYWQNGKICDNCVSVRAYSENKSYMKLEQTPDFILLVTAIPVNNLERPLVVELLKNATDSIFVGDGNYNGEARLLKNVVSEINDLISKDPLSGLYNRRYIFERLPCDVADAIINEKPLSVCFMDLNNFKRVNDLYGHDAGDKIIKSVGAVIASNIRNDTDWAARYGGDEFLICFNNTDQAQAEKVANRIKESIKNMPTSFIEGKVELSTSFGIHTMTEPTTAEELIKLADKKMYEGKRDAK